MNADIQRGFDQNAVMSGMGNVQNSITAGFGDIQTALCGGFAGINANIANGFAQAEIGENARQMANMNQMFALQTSIGNGVRDIIASQNSSTERVLSALCQNEIDTLKGQVVSLQNQLNMANLAASQVAQTQQIITALTPTV